MDIGIVLVYNLLKKNKIQKFKKKKTKKKTGDLKYIYQNELNKACFQHGMP